MITHLENWNVSVGTFPAEKSSAEKFEFFLKYAVLAPSSHNTQPWLFRIRGQEVEMYADRTRALRVADPNDRELIISCGAALFNLRCAMRHFGYLGEVAVFPDEGDPDLLARVTIGNKTESSPEESLVFHAIPKRRTNRQPFLQDAVPDSLLEVIARGVESEGAWLEAVREENTRYALADLIGQADRQQWANKRFRLELAAWVHSNRSNVRDGIPGYAQSVDDLLSYAGPLVVRTFDMGEGQAAKDREIAVYSPALVVLGTDGDSPRDWLATGQALAYTLLRARVEDVWASFLNQPIEVGELRGKVSRAIRREGYPQLILRLGFGAEVKPTPRREVQQVLI